MKTAWIVKAHWKLATQHINQPKETDWKKDCEDYGNFMMGIGEGEA